MGVDELGCGCAVMGKRGGGFLKRRNWWCGCEKRRMRYRCWTSWRAGFGGCPLLLLRRHDLTIYDTVLTKRFSVPEVCLRAALLASSSTPGFGDSSVELRHTLFVCLLAVQFALLFARSLGCSPGVFGC